MSDPQNKVEPQTWRNGLVFRLAIAGHLFIVRIPSVHKRVYFAHYRPEEWDTWLKPRFEFNLEF